jgi:type IV secretory pathway VirB2 component (pilin)
MKKSGKIIVALFIVLTIITIGVSSFATSESVTPSSFNGGTANISGIDTLGKNIVATVRIIGTLVAVVILLILGIKYMIGSAEEKADYKKSMIPYLVGAICVFAATTLADIVYNMANSLNSSSN